MFRLMNIVLITLLCAAAGQAADPIQGYEALTYKDGQGHTLDYRLRKPAEMKPGTKYPLVLFLHGAGERGDDNAKQLKFLPNWLAEEPYASKYPCFVIAPQCPNEKIWASFHWKTPQEEARMAKAPVAEMAMVMAVLQEQMKNPAVDLSRVYLTGLSMGGYGTWELAARKPDWFAAAAPICGGGDVSQGKRYVKLPLWAWHGDKDDAVPVERSRIMIEAIKKAGGDPKYTELPGVGHNAWTDAYRREDGVVPWLFEQKKK